MAKKQEEKETNTATADKKGVLAGILGLVTNLILFVSKLMIGLFSGSVSIMADAVNSLSDTASSILTLIGFKIAAKPADQNILMDTNASNISVGYLFRSSLLM